MIKWGIIGLGNMGQKFARAITETNNSNLAGIASKDINKIKNFTSKHNFKDLVTYNNYDEIILMTPDAILLDQKISNRLSTLKNIIIICGHYKGVDQRVRDNLITMELSIGNYVLSGGELPAAVLCDSIIRLIPGVLNNETSALTDSFQDNLLAPPVYTRPSIYNNIKVPELLLSGDKTKIEDWREKKSIEKTNKLRPEMLDE